MAHDLLAAVKSFEGFSAQAKWDFAQHSNGYGTRARAPGEVIDVKEAEFRLVMELKSASDLVEKFAPSLDEGTKAALTSLTFNAGTKWMSDGLGQAIRRGDLDAARSIFVEYNKAGGKILPGLVARRQAEVKWIGSNLDAGAQPRHLTSVDNANRSSTSSGAVDFAEPKVTMASPAEQSSGPNSKIADQVLAYLALMAFDPTSLADRHSDPQNEDKHQQVV